MMHGKRRNLQYCTMSLPFQTIGVNTESYSDVLVLMHTDVRSVDPVPIHRYYCFPVRPLLPGSRFCKYRNRRSCPPCFVQYLLLLLPHSVHLRGCTRRNSPAAIINSAVQVYCTRWAICEFKIMPSVCSAACTNYLYV